MKPKPVTRARVQTPLKVSPASVPPLTMNARQTIYCIDFSRSERKTYGKPRGGAPSFTLFSRRLSGRLIAPGDSAPSLRGDVLTGGWAGEGARPTRLHQLQRAHFGQEFAVRPRLG